MNKQKKLDYTKPGRSVKEVGAGDFVKIGTHWEKIVSNSAAGQEQLPKDWTVKTEHGAYGMFNINRYAKKEDFEE